MELLETSNLLNQLEQQILVLNPEYRIRYQNIAAQQHLNGELREAEAPCFHRFYLRDTPCELCPVQRLLLEHQAVRGNFYCMGALHQVWAQQVNWEGSNQILLQLQVPSEPERAPYPQLENREPYRFLSEDLVYAATVHERIERTDAPVPEYRFTFVNRAFESLTGLHQSDILNRPLHEVMPDIAEAWMANFQAVSDSENQRSFQLPLPHSDRVAEFTVYMLPSQAFITRIHDMTQQAKSVQILQESEERYRKLVEASTNLVLLFNSTGYVFANPAALKALGYPHFESISEHNPIELFHPDEMEQVRPKLESCQRGETNEPMDVHLHRSDGSYLLTESVFLPIQYQQEYSTLVLGHDITERRHSEGMMAEADAIIRKIQEGVSGVVGEDFFPVMVEKLAVILKADYTYVGELSAANKQWVSTLSFFSKGHIAPNFQYGLKDTPCEEVFNRPFQAIERGASERYPNDVFLKERNIEGYIGVALKNSRGEPVGLIVALFQEPVQNLQQASMVLDIFSARTGAEIVRMRAERDLEEAHEKFRSIAENLPDIILRIDRDMRGMYVNAKVEEYTGIPPGNFMGTHLLDLDLKESFLQNRLEDLNRVLASREMSQTLVSVNTLKGYRTLEWRMIPEFSVDGEVESILNLIRDLTEIRRTEMELNQLFNLSADLICITDIGGNFIRVNPAWEQQLGHAEQDLLGHSMYELIHPEDVEPTRQSIVAKLRSNEILFNYENRYLCKDGTHRWLSWVVQPYSDMDKMFCIARDVTENKKNFRELIMAKEKAEEGDRLKTAFLANMSHEIRTPMNAIIGFSTLLKREDLSLAKRLHYTNIIESRSKDLLSIIHDLLDISKIESEQIQIIREDFSINDFLEELREDYHQKLSAMDDYSIQLQLRKPKGLPRERIINDRVRVKQVMINLLDNAIKFTKKGQVTFGAVPQSDKLLFFVSDTGIGIKKSKQKAIFERFRQVENSLTRQYGGNGLGLSISKALVELMGGTIWVDSEEGTGSSFYFTLPALFKEEPFGQTVKKMSKVGENLRMNGMKVLVADADKMSRNFLRVLFDQLGAEVCFAHSGKRTLELLEENHHFALLLFDIHLPDIKGYDLLCQIRSRNKQLPVIAQSSMYTSENTSRCTELGCTEHLSKPILIDDLLASVQRLLFPT